MRSGLCSSRDLVRFYLLLYFALEFTLIAIMFVISLRIREHLCWSSLILIIDALHSISISMWDRNVSWLNQCWLISRVLVWLFFLFVMQRISRVHLGKLWTSTGFGASDLGSCAYARFERLSFLGQRWRQATMLVCMTCWGLCSSQFFSLSSLRRFF